ncbi:MAG TPA: hypothetical protein VNJ03_03280 [Vicinamibacterales bacterium]|nr:hypothetical protein [Vicinamibacterales bacterium]
MSSRTTRFLGFTASAILMSVALGAQDRPAPAASSDPRVGLKPGLRDAGQASRGMELVSTLPKPEGFNDFPPRPGAVAAAAAAVAPPTTPPPAVMPPPGSTPAAPAPPQPPPARGFSLDFANSDLAFRGDDLFIGNFNGFNAYDIENTKKPRLLASIVCPGGQGDVSIHGTLVFMSVEQTRGRLDCGTKGVAAPVSTERFRGIRIFDITDIKKPKQIASVQTCRGSHTHTLVVDKDDTANVYIYGSGTGTPRAGEELSGCSAGKPDEDANTSLFSIDVIQVPLAAPATAKVVSRPRIFADLQTGAIAGLAKAREAAEGVQPSRETNQCHDITVFPELGLAAGACSGNGILLDISDPVRPVRLDAVGDKNFAYWHSATFNNDGTKVIFTDEWGGGTSPRCRATDSLTWGANAIFDIVDRKMTFGGYFKMPAPQTDVENCVAHNGSLIPVPGRDIMVQAWYQGGVSVFDFTDSAKPVEIAFFDRGPIDPKRLVIGGFWSTYWYNGRIYGTELVRGIDIFRLTPSEFLSQNEIDAAMLVHMESFNAQMQTKVTWPAHPMVARAYLDQLTRSNAITAERASAVRKAVEKNKRAQLTTLAQQLEQDAAGASGAAASRMKALAAVLKGR